MDKLFFMAKGVSNLCIRSILVPISRELCLDAGGCGHMTAKVSKVLEFSTTKGQKVNLMGAYSSYGIMGEGVYG